MEAKRQGIGVTLVHVAAGLVLAVCGVGGVQVAGGAVTTGVVVLYAVLGLLVAVLPPVLIARTLSRPLQEFENVMGATRIDGDLSRAVFVSDHALLGPAAKAYKG